MFDVPVLILSVLKLSLQEYTDVTAVQKDLDLIRDNAYSRCTAGTGGGWMRFGSWRADALLAAACDDGIFRAVSSLLFTLH